VEATGFCLGKIELTSYPLRYRLRKNQFLEGILNQLTGVLLFISLLAVCGCSEQSAKKSVATPSPNAAEEQKADSHLSGNKASGGADVAPGADLSADHLSGGVTASPSDPDPHVSGS